KDLDTISIDKAMADTNNNSLKKELETKKESLFYKEESFEELRVGDILYPKNEKIEIDTIKNKGEKEH
ncbi:hypothetical protein, partial [Campylobacter fetus]|uniref:hypothetical protein n=1 Tax=Campylobacter fetus TaxID=196 RepID=UPI0013015875